jgi:dipeptidase E
MRQILLLSNSTLHGRGYLDHGEAEIRALFAGLASVLFVPYALHDRDGYADKAAKRFRAMGIRLDSIHRAGHPLGAVEDAEAIFIGGGNTFRLLLELYRADVVDAIRERVAGGMPYMGSSAGSNVACPTIKTTNDMPIVEPPAFDALALVSFQICPHYRDPDPTSTHMGETQEERLMQFHEENATPVAALREGALLRITGPSIRLLGTTGARIFRRGQSPAEAAPGADLADLLGPVGP